MEHCTKEELSDQCLTAQQVGLRGKATEIGSMIELLHTRVGIPTEGSVSDHIYTIYMALYSKLTQHLTSFIQDHGIAHCVTS